MKARIAILILFATCSISLFAGNDVKNTSPESASLSTISLSVKDKLTGESLTGVLITISETGTKAYTDLEGICRIQDVPAGKYKIYASYVSYNETILEEVKVSAGNTQNITIELSPTR